MQTVTQLDLITTKCTSLMSTNLCDIYFIVLFKGPHTFKGQLLFPMTSCDGYTRNQGGSHPHIHSSMVKIFYNVIY